MRWNQRERDRDGAVADGARERDERRDAGRDRALVEAELRAVARVHAPEASL